MNWEISPADFGSRFRRDFSAWKAIVEEICIGHGIQAVRITPFSEGSNLVASVDNWRIVKIFPPFHRHQWESERSALSHLRSHGLSISIPELVAQGVRDDGWAYVILSCLSGVTLDSIWKDLSDAEKAAFLQEIGSIMARLHATPVGKLQTLQPEWTAFLRSQADGCKARHRRMGAPAWLLDGIDGFIAERIAGLADRPLVILTGEFTPFNLMVSQTKGRLGITGMIDFGDVMIGLPAYDFVGPCLFSCEGKGNLIDALFDAYGIASPREDSAMRGELMLLVLLHRYSDLKSQLRMDSWEFRARSIPELERLIFGV